jgi:hypothetical protein
MVVLMVGLTAKKTAALKVVLMALLMVVLMALLMVVL